MKVITFVYMVAPLVYAKTLKVFHNTFDPALVWSGAQRPKGGAHHIGEGDGNVDALTICVRFQVSSAQIHR